ncbi:MAG: ammonia-forming cytochrome c nitrite reductase subunit c552 [Chloroflexi bacterium]|nr:ammonia-forming cytochrome c nitrite reductase subunit c552 [Chloroflexota bacterium]
MRRAIMWSLLVCAVGCLTFGFFLLQTGRVVAQDARAEADFIGAGDCQDCHRSLARDHEDTPHARALLDVERRKDDILADFALGEDLRMVTFPGEEAPRPFTEDDIVLAIGAGRYAQRYVYEVDTREYAVFPAEWDTVTGEWRPYRLADSWPAPEYDFTQNCAGCHTTGLELERGRWQDEGVQCEACHGPGGEHAEVADDAGSRPNDEERAEIHAAIVMSPDAQICGQCHVQGSTPDLSHTFPVNYLPGGDMLDAEVFQIPERDDPATFYETGHGRLNNMQFNEWFASAHSRSLETLLESPNAEDGCLTCHSGDTTFIQRILGVYEDGDLEGTPPELPTLSTAQFGVTCTTCHSPHEAAEVDFHLVSEPDDLCAACHQNTELIQPIHHPSMEMFQGQTMIDGIEGVASAHFADENGPGCVDCHMSGMPVGSASLASHRFRPVIPGEVEDSPPDACSECHTDLTTADLQSLVLDTQTSVRGRLTVALARLGSITPPEEGSDAGAQFERVRAALTFIQNDGSLGVHNYPYVDKLLDSVSTDLAQLSVPGALLQPTEGPAPTATPSQAMPIPVGVESHVRSGARPMTLIIIAITVLILLLGTALILRQARRRMPEQEAAR